MPDISDAQVHWILGGGIAAGMSMFMFLLKRTFADFEDKIGQLFRKLEKSLDQAQSHDTKIAVIEIRLNNLENKGK